MLQTKRYVIRGNWIQLCSQPIIYVNLVLEKIKESIIKYDNDKGTLGFFNSHLFAVDCVSESIKAVQ